MDRLSDDTLQSLRDIPIKDVAERLGVELGRGRANARCFNTQAHKHGDKNGSLGFDERTNRFKCFACGTSGDTIALVEQVEGKGFREASEYLANLFGIVVSQQKLATKLARYPKTNTARKLALMSAEQGIAITRKSPYQNYNDPIRLNKAYEYDDLPHADIYQEFYNNTEAPNQALKDWWYGRGFSDELLEAYGWRIITPSTYAKTLKRYNESDLEQSGLIRRVNGQIRHIFHNHAVATPYFDAGQSENGRRVLYLRGRTLDPTQKAKYLSPCGTSPVIYGFDRLFWWMVNNPYEQPLYVTESETDAIAITELAKRQGKEVTAIALVGGQKTEHSRVVRELVEVLSALDKGLTINIVTDRDTTGDVFYNAVATAFYKAGFNPHNLIKWQEWHEDLKDVGDHLQKLANGRTAKQGVESKNNKELENE